MFDHNLFPVLQAQNELPKRHGVDQPADFGSNGINSWQAFLSFAKAFYPALLDGDNSFGPELWP